MPTENEVKIDTENEVKIGNCDCCGKYPAIYMSLRTPESRFLCMDCVKREADLIIKQELSQLSIIKRERILIIIGIIIGMVLSFYVDYMYIKTDSYILTFVFLFPIWITCSCGIIISIISKIKTDISNKNNDFIIILINTIANIVFSPVTLIKRLIAIHNTIKETKEDHILFLKAIDTLENEVLKINPTQNDYLEKDSEKCN